MKKVILILNLTLIPFYTFAYEGTISQSGSCGATDADCHYTLYEDGHLEIIGTGKMTDYDYTYPIAPWGGEISTLSISGVTSIGNCAFRGSNITDVIIPASVETIGEAAFQSSKMLEKVTFQDNSQLKSIYGAAFNNTNLNNIDIPNSVTLIGNNVFNYTNINNIVLPDSIFSVDDYVTEGMTGGYFHGLSIKALSDVEHIYCSKAAQSECEKYFNEAEFYDFNVRDYVPLKEKASLAIYTSDGDKFYANGKWYDSLSDMNKGRYNVKRIYTIDEANQVAGDKNRVSIKYR